MTTLGSITCGFCPRTPARSYMLAASATGNREKASSWHQQTQDLCARCHGILSTAGKRGRLFKKTGIVWRLVGDAVPSL